MEMIFLQSLCMKTVDEIFKLDFNQPNTETDLQ